MAESFKGDVREDSQAGPDRERLEFEMAWPFKIFEVRHMILESNQFDQAVRGSQGTKGAIARVQLGRRSMPAKISSMYPARHQEGILSKRRKG